ncbi:MAG: hypothetical protein ABFD07_04820 [Methanobacterium sp.]
MLQKLYEEKIIGPYGIYGCPKCGEVVDDIREGCKKCEYNGKSKT